MCVQAAVAGVNLPPNAPAPMRFAADEIARAAGGKRSAIDVSLAILSNGVPQSYRIEAMARLGQYHAAKIDGAAELALFDATSKPEHRAAAVKHLGEALARWRDYAAVYISQYRQPILYGRVGLVDLPKLTESAASDIAIARDWKPGSLPELQPKRKSGK